MSILKPWHSTMPSSIPELLDYDVKFDAKQYAIGGKLLTHSICVPMSEQLRFRDEDNFKRYIKKNMADNLALAMIEMNLIEFTKEPNYSEDKIFIRARCYLAPDDQVKILRVYAHE